MPAPPAIVGPQLQIAVFIDFENIALGRMPWNRNETLWGGYVIRGPEGTAYHSGDTAWGEHFAEIRARVGAIDWAMLPIGGYAPRWFMAPQHIDPIEAARAWEALGAGHLLAMHWGTFKLTDEAIGEPPVIDCFGLRLRRTEPATSGEVRSFSVGGSEG